MVKIIQYNWLSKDAEEAEVIISDGLFDLHCFSHPFAGEIGDSIKLPLYALDPADFIKKEYQVYGLRKLASSYGYEIIGLITNIEKGLIKVGNIIIEIDTPLIPADLINGDFISFKCDRVDIY